MVSHDGPHVAPAVPARRGAHVTIVRPPATSSRFSYTIGVVLPLGPAYLAGSLLEAGHRAAIVDALGEAPFQRGPTSHPHLIYHGLSIPEIVERIDLATDAIAMSVMFSQQWPHVDDLIRAVHARFPDRPIFVGGEHVTGTWRFVLDTCPPVIACAIGEGEETMVELAEYVAGGRDLADVAGIACRIGGRPQRTAPRERIRSIDDIARPAWHLVPVANYLDGGFTYGVNLGRSMPILATRGCPYRCTFCSSPAMWTTRYYVRDVTAVVDEIASYVGRYGATNIDFYDLTAIIKRDWILKFCAELERRRLVITYQLPTGTRSEALDEEVLAALRRTGCRNICYAPESGSPETLARIKKKIKPDRMLRSIRAATGAGIVVKANIMIGFPDETRRELWQTVRFGMKLARLGVEDIPLFPFIPYPGTELYDSLRARGVLPELSNEYFAELGYGDLDSVRSLSPHISSRQLAIVRLVGMLAFLMVGYARRPWRVLRTLRALFTERSTTVVELRLVDIKRRLLARLGLRRRHAVARPDARPVAINEDPPGDSPADVDGGHRVSCVLPAYNEREGLADTVAGWAAALEPCTRDYEIIVVDDGSNDGTAALLRDLRDRHASLRVVTHSSNRGYGAAITNGFAHAAFPLVLFSDADGQYEPRDIGVLLEHIDRAKVVVGYRLRRADTWTRRVLSHGYNVLVRWVVGVSWRDINCAFKLMHRETFRRLGIESTGFSINAELAMCTRNARVPIIEVPVQHRPRRAGRSTVRPLHLVTTLYQLAWLRRRHRRSAFDGLVRAEAARDVPVEPGITSISARRAV